MRHEGPAADGGVGLILLSPGYPCMPPLPASELMTAITRQVKDSFAETGLPFRLCGKLTWEGRRRASLSFPATAISIPGRPGAAEAGLRRAGLRPGRE
jgi:hypothetical protein